MVFRAWLPPLIALLCGLLIGRSAKAPGALQLGRDSRNGPCPCLPKAAGSAGWRSRLPLGPSCRVRTPEQDRWGAGRCLPGQRCSGLFPPGVVLDFYISLCPQRARHAPWPSIQALQAPRFPGSSAFYPIITSIISAPPDGF